MRDAGQGPVMAEAPEGAADEAAEPEADASGEQDTTEG